MYPRPWKGLENGSQASPWSALWRGYDMSYGEVQGGMGSMASYNALEGADFTGDLEGEEHGRAIFLKR